MTVHFPGGAMNIRTRIEQELGIVLAAHEAPGVPPLLGQALRHAVFPGGARVRPRLCLAVAQACAGAEMQTALAAATSIELLHCASLVHDDLPCFDDADLRRGKPSVHKAFGERLAILAGDGLIVLAFQNLLRVGSSSMQRLAPLLQVIGASVSAVNGIVAGQAWECEPALDLGHYHRAKTGALFAAATMAGAISAGREPEAWRACGERLGEAFQVADDLRDVIASVDELGKPPGKDAALDRPSAVRDLGLHGAMRRLNELLRETRELIPACEGGELLCRLIASETQRLLPKELARRAA